MVAKTLTNSVQVCIIDNDAAIRWVLEKTLQKMGLTYQSFSNYDAWLEAYSTDTSLKLMIMDEAILKQINKHTYFQYAIATIIMSGRSNRVDPIDISELGSQAALLDYLIKPFDLETMINTIKRGLNYESVNISSDNQPEFTQAVLLGNSLVMQNLRQTVVSLSPKHTNAVLVGAPGTGKSALANIIHGYSLRSHHTMQVIDLSYLTLSDIDLALFGDKQTQGILTSALGSTLLIKGLDNLFIRTQSSRQEPTNLAGSIQIKLADWLRLHTANSISSSAHYTDTSNQHTLRLILSVQEDLEQPLQQGLILPSLYDSINGVIVKLPTLKQHAEDIALLAPYFLQQTAQELSTETKHLAPETMAYLKQKRWLGNLRQLRSVCAKLNLLSTGNTITISDLPPELSPCMDNETITWEALLREKVNHKLNQGNTHALMDMSIEVEKILINIALERSRGHKQEAAKLLGLGRNTLARKLKSL